MLPENLVKPDVFLLTYRRVQVGPLGHFPPRGSLLGSIWRWPSIFLPTRRLKTICVIAFGGDYSKEIPTGGPPGGPSGICALMFSRRASRKAYKTCRVLIPRRVQVGPLGQFLPKWSLLGSIWRRPSIFLQAGKLTTSCLIAFGGDCSKEIATAGSPGGPSGICALRCSRRASRKVSKT